MLCMAHVFMVKAVIYLSKGLDIIAKMLADEATQWLQVKYLAIKFDIM